MPRYASLDKGQRLRRASGAGANIGKLATKYLRMWDNYWSHANIKDSRRHSHHVLHTASTTLPTTAPPDRLYRCLNGIHLPVRVALRPNPAQGSWRGSVYSDSCAGLFYRAGDCG